jgi:predicted site-specific integrase-resolvase
MSTENWVDIKAVASHLDVSVASVRRYTQAGDIPGIKLGGQWKYQLSKVNEAIESKTADPWAPSPRSRNRRRVA